MTFSPLKGFGRPIAIRLTAILAHALLGAAAVGAQQQVDVLIRGGTMVDGTGGPPRAADVGIRGDRIAFIGNAAGARVTATRTIDARGLIVAPGFIDPHTHTAGDLANAQRRANLPYLMQGVTTVVTNNDGGGGIEIGKALDVLTTNGIGTNALLYIGQGSVRGRVLGMSDAAPTAAQLDSMRAIVARAMDDGAIGLSTGLYYAPGSYATTEEVIELAKVASAKGGIYDSHVRDESSYTIGLIGSVLETIRIGREAQLPVHISHIKALGADVWGQADSVNALIRRARADGIDVTADQYPYTASGTSVGASLLPRWAEAGGNDSLRSRFANPAVRARIVREMEDNLRRRGGAASLLMTSTRDTTILGKTLDVIARARNVAPVEAAVQIILNGGSGVASFNMNEKDIETFMVQDFVGTGSDGSDGHPRKYGTFPRLLREYVFTRHILTLPQAVHRSSALTAQQLRIQDRGVLATGKFADVIVFDSATVADRSTYREPTLLATGMRYVLVNGIVAVDDGKATGVMGGRALRRAGSVTSRRSVPDSVAARIDAVFARYAANAPGCAVGVFQNGAIAYARGYGSANLEYGTPITATTPFIMGSVSKQFTAAAIALLIEDGRIGLNDDVRKYVPELPNYGAPITIDQLVHHTSGLRDFWAIVQTAGMRNDDGYTVADVLRLAARQKHLNFAPGTEYDYSNTGYVVLGVVVQRVTGKSLRDFADERIFRPLGMTHTHYHDDHTMIVDGRAAAYNPAPDGGWRINVWNNDIVGQGGVMTTVEDLLAWDENFYSGTVGGRGFLARQLTQGRLANDSLLSYAFGLVVGEYRGQKMVEHTGATGGYRTVITRFPATHMSAVVLCNVGTADPATLAHRVADVVIASSFAAPVAVAGPRNGVAPSRTAPAAFVVQQLAPFAGRFYSAELDAVYVLRVSGQALVLERPRARPDTLRAVDARTFRVAGNTLRFTLPAKGSAPSFLLDVGRSRGVEFQRTTDRR